MLNKLGKVMRAQDMEVLYNGCCICHPNSPYRHQVFYLCFIRLGISFRTYTSMPRFRCDGSIGAAVLSTGETWREACSYQ